MPERFDSKPMSLTLSLGDDTFSCEGSLRDVRVFLELWLSVRGGPDQSAERALQDAAAKIRTGAVQVDNATSTIDQLGHEGA